MHEVVQAAPPIAARPASAGRARSRYFVWLAGGVLAISGLAFGATYVVPLARGHSFPGVLHVHGAAGAAWLVLLFAQALLIDRRRVAVHRTLGLIGIPLIPVVVVTGVAAAAWAAQRDMLTRGVPEPQALTTFLGSVTSVLLFGGFATAALALRRRSAAHKRLMVVATIPVLPTIFARVNLLLGIPMMLPLLGSLGLILSLVLHDRRSAGRLHPVTWITLATFVVLTVAGPPVHGSAPVQSLARVLVARMGGY